MVTTSVDDAALRAVAIVAAPAPDRTRTLPPTTTAAAQMALLGIALVGLLLVVIILLGGHWVRRQGTMRRGPVVPPDRAPLSSSGSATPSAGDSSPASKSPANDAPRDDD